MRNALVGLIAALTACTTSPSPDAGDVDASARLDAASIDASAPLDASALLDAASIDASTPDGAACDPDAVRFVPAGPRLAEGAFCDDVFACASGPDEAAAIEAASPRFRCSPVPEGPCTGITCAYRDPSGPGVLDAAELAEICRVTVLSPRPSLVCLVYL